MQKFETFLEIVDGLSKKFNTVPVLYGSMGLGRVIGQDFEPNDIDVLVPDEFMVDRWPEFLDFMKSLGFELKDEYEHEFERGGDKVNFATQERLGDIGLRVADLRLNSDNSHAYYELSPEQYLEAYRYVLQDGYRQTKKSDKDKIEAIERYISGQK